MKSSTPFDVVVAGAGPAGLALAGEIAARGATVAVVDGRFGRAWESTYGAFLDEIEGLGLVGCVARSWSRPLVFTGEAPRELGRAYARFDNEALRGRLLARAGDATRFLNRVVGVHAREGGVDLGLDDGRLLRASVLVDATGVGTWLGRSPSRSAQVALGRIVELSRVPWAEDEAVWMDLRGHDDQAPSFLYALPLGGDRVLLEETSLASSPPMAWRVLEARLEDRIAAWGLQVRRTVGHERVYIPLDGGIPAPRGPIVGFGAAGGFVHPSTGYSVVRSLRSAAGFADALVRGLEGGDGAAAADAAFASVWPLSAQISRFLHQTGLKVLLSLNGAQTRRFFESFFALSPAGQAAWLDGTASPVAGAGAMAAMFAAAPWSVRSDVLMAVFDLTGRMPRFPVPRPGGPT